MNAIVHNVTGQLGLPIVKMAIATAPTTASIAKNEAMTEAVRAAGGRAFIFVSMMLAVYDGECNEIIGSICACPKYVCAMCDLCRIDSPVLTMRKLLHFCHGARDRAL
jgi:poly(A) polymerase Pap1